MAISPDLEMEAMSASAMSSFEAAATAVSTTAKLEVPSSVGTTVAALADAIGNYDNKLTATTNAVASEETLRLKALQGGNHNGFLAAK